MTPEQEAQKRRARAEAERRERNARLAEQVKRGDVIPPLVDGDAMRYPPRPKIRKDAAAIRAVYGPGDAKDGAAGDEPPEGADAP